jgi:ABC-type transporter Mla maintaining outer membrane lipid asymmetry ATPase subunit MlaF
MIMLHLVCKDERGTEDEKKIKCCQHWNGLDWLGLKISFPSQLSGGMQKRALALHELVFVACIHIVLISCCLDPVYNDSISNLLLPHRINMQ